MESQWKKNFITFSWFLALTSCCKWKIKIEER
jgi:hypothetical protein